MVPIGRLFLLICNGLRVEKECSCRVSVCVYGRGMIEKRKPEKRMRDEWKEVGIGEIGEMTASEANAVAEWMRRHGKSVVRKKEGEVVRVWRDK